MKLFNKNIKREKQIEKGISSLECCSQCKYKLEDRINFQ